MSNPSEMLSPGVQLEALCQEAHSELLLVAPFIKFSAFNRLLSSVAKDVRVVCVTRWRPDEIAAGVSDIEIWHSVQELELSSLWLRHDLHAKYYRADQKCLVGSANITSSALGWATPSNYELLIPSFFDERLAKFETVLFTGCVAVDNSIYLHTQSVVECLPKSQPPRELVFAPADAGEAVEVRVDVSIWLPRLRSPEQLIVAYRGNLELLTAGTKEASLRDLAFLQVPSGLTKQQFDQYIRAVLFQLPIVKKVDHFIETPRRFGEVKTLLKELFADQALASIDAAEAWQTLMRWLLYFYPERYTYTRPRHTEIFARKRSSEKE